MGFHGDAKPAIDPFLAVNAILGVSSLLKRKPLFTALILPSPVSEKTSFLKR